MGVILTWVNKEECESHVRKLGEIGDEIRLKIEELNELYKTIPKPIIEKQEVIKS
jgi:hypothetical protein